MPLRNIDYSDLELLFVMDEVADAEGLILAQDIADRLGIRANGNRTPAGTVLGRLSWMGTHKPDCPRGCRRHYGFIQRIDARSLGLKASDPPRFVITEIGRTLMGGRVNAAITKELERGHPGTELLLMREVAQRGYVNGDASVAAAVRREWQHQEARRR